MHKDKLKTGYDKTYSEQYDKVVWCEIDDNKYLGSLCKRKHNKNYYVKYDGKIYDIVLTTDINQAKRYRDSEHADVRNVGNYDKQPVKIGFYI
jgi:hypothetical protein